MTHVVRSEFVLGGQKSGKSRRAESLAQHWLAGSPQRSAFLIATAQAFDDEMRLRIERHRQDRLVRVPGMKTIEEPLALAATIAAFSHPDTLIVIDCLTLWLTAQLMPPNADLVPTPTACHAVHESKVINSHTSTNQLPSTSWQTLATDLCHAIAHAPGPIILVGNEIGLGVIPLGQEVRAFVDALGLLNQRVAATCERVTLMSAGLPLTLKGPA
jgi:adenosylcobinamide kinase/adenosylcobinamide-phosphate guanylyltransferase